MSELKKVGKPALRVDALEKVLGTARYTHDLKIPGMLVAKVLRSPVPHAEIVKLDVSPALKVPGVVVAITSEDYVNHSNWGFPVKDDYMLAYKKVRYVGDPIAAVAAESEEAAEAGLKAIILELKELPGVFDMQAALRPDAPIIHDELEPEPQEQEGELEDAEFIETHTEGNLSDKLIVRQGDPLSKLQECDVVVDAYYSVSHQEHAYLETEAALAVPTADGGVTVYVGDQSPFITLGNLVDTLGLPGKVRVIQSPHIGGAFGGKSDMVYETAGQAAMLALKAGRPVKLTTSREESMLASYKRDAMEMHYRLGADKEGRLRAAKIQCWADSGAHASQTPFTSWRATIHAMGPYRYEDCHVDIMGIYTNNGYSGAFRGFGNTEVTAVSEQAIDELAAKLDMDPLDFRLKNCVELGDTLPFGQKLESSVGLKDCLLRVRELSDWDRKRAEYSRQPAELERRRGIGVSSLFHGISLGAEGLDFAEHTIRLAEDNRFEILTGLTDYGQGARTVFTLIAAEVLDLPTDRFRWMPCDTDIVHDCGPTVASRSSILGGNATRLAALRLLTQIHEAAAMMLRCQVPHIRQQGESFQNPDGKQVSLDDIIAFAREHHLPLSAKARWEMPRIHWSFSKGRGIPYVAYHFGAQVAEVEVDVRTGVTRVEHIYAVHDVGKVIYPQGIRGQIIGGISQGLGYALMERVDFHKGHIQNLNFDTYLIPTAADMPRVTVDFVESELPFGPFGAKNTAEPSMVPTAPAILNAIFHATGKRIRHLPANLERVLLGYDLTDTVVTVCDAGTCERARCEI